MGDFAAFSYRAVTGIFGRQMQARVLVPIFFNVGVNSIGVAVITGLFIGMVMAVETYSQFHPFGFDAAMGTITCNAILSELGPVLAAVMLAGRVGSSMAAELGTMRVSEQIDALACLGVDPVHYLATPRFLACLLLIPLLTVLADAAGIIGSTFICVVVYRIDSHHFWEHTLNFVGTWEVISGMVKATVFGGVMALVSCHRGFRSRAGAEGVGRAATEAFVFSFMVILILDFFLAFSLSNVHRMLWPERVTAGF
ncbi:MAG: ABC transporter permease [Planctomycetes bacterium]|nr:ABC transporter permease [Planctomycetota bacterium]